MREKIDFYQQGLLDDDSPARVQDLLTGYTSKIPYVGGLLSDVIDPREVQAADLDRNAAFAQLVLAGQMSCNKPLDNAVQQC